MVAIFNITAPALDLSYIAVILAHLVYEHRVRFIEGPYTLGRWGKPVNIVAIVWVCFISVVLFFPPVKPVTAKNMSVHRSSNREDSLADIHTGIMRFVWPLSLASSRCLGGG